jgi:AAA domain, putative AbiEii toxin, Type IV TA system/Protein of unknown function (DUF4435)
MPTARRDPRRFTLSMPPSSAGQTQPTALENAGTTVVVGANGSGKSRFGSWLELTSSQKDIVHRVSAQKSLMMPDTVHTTNMDAAEKHLFFGFAGGNIHNKTGHRWGNNPYTHLLNDFEALMVYLFTENADKSDEYRRQAIKTTERIPPPETKLDVIKRIWEKVLPRRELEVGTGKVNAKIRGNSRPSYKGKDMSDGERVIFYLIGECLATPANGIMVVDEPELHLHKSLQGTLWDEIEAARPDCQFVYLTHDLDFAATRVSAQKVCLRDYDGEKWDWFIVPEADGIPEEMFLQLVGSRKPILFVEGDKTSLDYHIYSYLYPSFTLIPCGVGSQVIHATSTFRSLLALHHLECRGVVDRDCRTDQQVAWLKDRHVFVSELSEIENLLLAEDVLRALAAELLKDPVDVVANVKEMVLGQLEREKERIVSAIAASTIEARFKTFDAKARGENALQMSLDALLAATDVATIYRDVEHRVTKILTDRNYHEAIKIFDNKGLCAQSASIFGQKSKDEFLDYIKKLISDERGTPLVAAMRALMPAIVV